MTQTDAKKKELSVHVKSTATKRKAELEKHHQATCAKKRARSGSGNGEGQSDGAEEAEESIEALLLADAYNTFREKRKSRKITQMAKLVETQLIANDAVNVLTYVNAVYELLLTAKDEIKEQQLSRTRAQNSCDRWITELDFTRSWFNVMRNVKVLECYWVQRVITVLIGMLILANIMSKDMPEPFNGSWWDPEEPAAAVGGGAQGGAGPGTLPDAAPDAAPDGGGAAAAPAVPPPVTAQIIDTMLSTITGIDVKFSASVEHQKKIFKLTTSEECIRGVLSGTYTPFGQEVLTADQCYEKALLVLADLHVLYDHIRKKTMAQVVDTEVGPQIISRSDDVFQGADLSSEPPTAPVTRRGQRGRGRRR